MSVLKTDRQPDRQTDGFVGKPRLRSARHTHAGRQRCATPSLRRSCESTESSSSHRALTVATKPTVGAARWDQTRCAPSVVSSRVDWRCSQSTVPEQFSPVRPSVDASRLSARDMQMSRARARSRGPPRCGPRAHSAACPRRGALFVVDCLLRPRQWQWQQSAAKPNRRSSLVTPPLDTAGVRACVCRAPIVLVLALLSRSRISRDDVATTDVR